MSASCGGCTLCCKLLGVPGITKPGSWCRHCKPGEGCGIYAERPPLCREFECGWLVSRLDDQLRPDKIHIIITGEVESIDAWVLHVDPAYPDAPRRLLGRLLIHSLVKSGKHRNVLLVTGSKRRLIGANPEAVERALVSSTPRSAEVSDTMEGTNEI